LLKRPLLAFTVPSVIGLSLPAAAVHARNSNLVGVVTRVEPGQIEIKRAKHSRAGTADAAASIRSIDTRDA
jgi:hypothetical protein